MVETKIIIPRNKRYINDLNEFPKVMKYLSKRLGELNIKTAVSSHGRTLLRTTAKELTLITYTDIQQEYTESDEGINLSPYGTYLAGHIGYLESLSDNIPTTFTGTDKIYITDETPAGRTVVLAVYYPKLNIIQIPFDFFHMDWLSMEEKDNMGMIDLIINKLKERIKEQKIEIKEIKFKEGDIATRIIHGLLERQIQDLSNEIGHTRRSVRDNIIRYEELRLQQFEQKRQLKYLKNIIKEDTSKVVQKLKEILQLPFVTQVEIGPDTKIRFKNTYIKGKFIGQFTLVITQEGFIRLTSKYGAQLASGDYYEHPHIEDSIPCWGTHKEQIYTLMHSLEYKKMIYLIYSFLNTYTQEDAYISLGGFLDERGEIDAPKEKRKTKELKIVEPPEKGLFQ